MTPPTPLPPHAARNPVLAAALDAVLVVVFAAVGRRSHAEGVTVAGVAQTAWPFLVGAALGWGGALLARLAPQSLRFGALVVAAAVVVGMLLRQASGAGTAAPFVIVASLTMTAFLLGWRLLATLIARRGATQHPAR